MSDVAKLAGVSTMTVSRVLNRHPSVKPAMQERVRAAVKQLRYRPNELAKSLRKQRSQQIGIIVPYLFDPFFAICAHGVSTVAQQHGYSVILSTSNENARTEFEQASRMLRRNVEGLVLIPAHPLQNRSLLVGDEFVDSPIVSLDRPIDNSGFDSVIVDNEDGARKGTQHLLSLGHKRVTYLGLQDTLYTMSMRHRGYSLAMSHAGLRPQAIFLSGELDDSREAVRKLMSGPRSPTALFCANNLITRHVLHGLQSLGMYPPDKIALVGFDDFETADLIRPGITVVRQPNELLGRTAAEVLFNRLENRESALPASITMLKTELVIRGSCGSTISP